MKKLNKVVIYFAVMFLFYGCFEKGSNDEQVFTKAVLSSNKSFIIADNKENAELTVTEYDQNGNKMEAGADVHIYLEGKEISDKNFKTDKAGDYQFSAKAGELYTNQIVITSEAPSYIDTVNYGLGKECELYKRHNRSYEWYIDQYTTGSRNFENCGPTSATMAVKWNDKSFCGTPENARATCKPEGGWWSTEDITNYLNKCGVKNGIVAAGNSREVLKRIIDMRKIAVLCIDSSKLRYNSKTEERVDCYYQNGSGHFIIVKGYVICDGGLYFEVYDPNSWGAKYSDGSLKGRDRYYRAEDINSAMNSWWQYAIVVSQAEESIAADTVFDYVDSKLIKHVRGR